MSVGGSQNSWVRHSRPWNSTDSTPTCRLLPSMLPYIPDKTPLQGFHFMPWPRPSSCFYASLKSKEPEIKLPTSIGSSKKQKSSRKMSTSALTMPKPLTVWITTKCWEFLKRWEYQTTWTASWESYMQDKKEQLELDMEQQIGSKLGKEYFKTVYCHPAYLTYL